MGHEASTRALCLSHGFRARVRAFLTHTVAPGQLFLPMHAESTNRLTPSIFDPYSRQPSYKHTAVNVVPEEG